MPATHIINKELISQIHKEFIKTKNKHTKQQKEQKIGSIKSQEKKRKQCSNPREDSQPHSKQDGPIK